MRRLRCMLRYIIERCLSKKGGRVDEGGEATLWMRLKIIFNELSLSFFLLYLLKAQVTRSRTRKYLKEQHLKYSKTTQRFDFN